MGVNPISPSGDGDMEFNRNISMLGTSASIELMQRAEQLRMLGKDVLSLAGGEPDFNTPNRICRAADKAICDGFTHYAVGRGLPLLREKIAEKLWKENDIKCSAENIIVTPGGKFGVYMAVCTLINEGDEVIILNPAWVSYGPIVKACGGIPVFVKLSYDDDYIIDVMKIREKITNKTKAIIINYPNNPTGKVLSANEARQLADVIRDTDIFVISDEIYERIVFDGNKSVSLASYREVSKNVITINGFSKCAAMTGWRLGYVVADDIVTNMMYKLYTHTITGTSTFIQHAALEVFNCNEEIEEMRKIYEKRRNYFVTELNQIKGLHCRKAEGAFYAWVNFDTKKRSEEIADQLLQQTGVVGVPGQAYGENKNCCMRFSFACMDNVLREAVDRMKKFVL